MGRPARASRKTVATELRRRGFSDTEVESLLTRHEEIWVRGERFLSNAEYVAREIIEADR